MHLLEKLLGDSDTIDGAVMVQVLVVLCIATHSTLGVDYIGVRVGHVGCLMEASGHERMLL